MLRDLESEEQNLEAALRDLDVKLNSLSTRSRPQPMAPPRPLGSAGNGRLQTSDSQLHSRPWLGSEQYKPSQPQRPPPQGEAGSRRFINELTAVGLQPPPGASALSPHTAAEWAHFAGAGLSRLQPLVAPQFPPNQSFAQVGAPQQNVGPSRWGQPAAQFLPHYPPAWSQPPGQFGVFAQSAAPYAPYAQQMPGQFGVPSARQQSGIASAPPALERAAQLQQGPMLGQQARQPPLQQRQFPQLQQFQPQQQFQQQQQQQPYDAAQSQHLAMLQRQQLERMSFAAQGGPPARWSHLPGGPMHGISQLSPQFSPVQGLAPQRQQSYDYYGGGGFPPGHGQIAGGMQQQPALSNRGGY